MLRLPPNLSTRLITALFVPQARRGMKHVLPCSHPITAAEPALALTGGSVWFGRCRTDHHRLMVTRYPSTSAAR